MITKNTGFAGDLFIPSKRYMKLTEGYSNKIELKTLITIADLFLIHDNVCFRADVNTIRELYTGFTMDEMNEMLINNRISFFLPIYARHYKSDWMKYLEQKLSDLNDSSGGFYKDKIDIKRVLKQINDNLVSQKIFEDDFSTLEKDMNELFYKKGIQRDSFFSMNVQIGFNQAIEKIREMWSCGIMSSTLDEEVLFYFDICNKAAFLQENKLPIEELNDSAHQIINELHSFKNCPTLSETLFKSNNPTRTMLNIVNSKEAMELKKWLQEANENNIDIRDLYTSTTSKLPSKDKWIDWLRFGGVTVVTGILGSIVSANPAVGLLIGGAGGAIDKMYGSKLIDSASKDYNPDAWFRFMNSTAANNV